MAFDFVLVGGRIIDPSCSIDQIADVGFSDGLVRAVGHDLVGRLILTKDVSGLIVTPGLIDLHTSRIRGWYLSRCRSSFAGSGGCTTLADTGSAGPGNFSGFVEHVIRRSPIRIVPFLNISFAGIFAFAKRVMVGECADIRLMAPEDAAEVAQRYRNVIAGIKVRVGTLASGSAGIAPVDIARAVAEQLDLPLIVHIDRPRPILADVLRRLRPGDIHPLFSSVSELPDGS